MLPYMARETGGVIKVKVLEMVRRAWIIQMGPLM